MQEDTQEAMFILISIANFSSSVSENSATYSRFHSLSIRATIPRMSDLVFVKCQVLQKPGFQPYYSTA